MNARNVLILEMRKAEQEVQRLKASIRAYDGRGDEPRKRRVTESKHKRRHGTRKKCEQCKRGFLASQSRVRFCSTSCSAKNHMTPERVKAMQLGRGVVKAKLRRAEKRGVTLIEGAKK